MHMFYGYEIDFEQEVNRCKRIQIHPQTLLMVFCLLKSESYNLIRNVCIRQKDKRKFIKRRSEYDHII